MMRDLLAGTRPGADGVPAPTMVRADPRGRLDAKPLVDAVRNQAEQQGAPVGAVFAPVAGSRSLARGPEGEHWQEQGLVFTTGIGTLLDPANLRRSLRQVTERAGLGRWHPHELRHSAASLLSAAGVPMEDVADILGHDGTRVTSSTYRHRTTSTVDAAAAPMDRMFGPAAGR